MHFIKVWILDSLWEREMVSKNHSALRKNLALLKAQISLQLGKVFSSDNGVSVSIMYSYTY